MSIKKDDPELTAQQLRIFMDIEQRLSDVTTRLETAEKKIEDILSHADRERRKIANSGR